MSLRRELLVTGSYPALPRMAYLCTGLFVGRLMLSSAKIGRRRNWPGPGYSTRRWTVSATCSLSVLTAPRRLTGWWWLATGTSRAGTPVDLLGGIGRAVALLRAMLLLGHVAVPSLRRLINVGTAVLAQAEAMTLTAYTVHVVFMNSPLAVFDPVLQVAADLPFGLGWRRTVGRGPLATAVTAAAAGARSVCRYAPRRHGTHRPGTAIQSSGSVTNGAERRRQLPRSPG